MKFIWAFKFSKSKDPVTKRDKAYDLYDFVKVSTYTIAYSVRSGLLTRPRAGYLDGSESVRMRNFSQICTSRGGY